MLLIASLKVDGACTKLGKVSLESDGATPVDKLMNKEVSITEERYEGVSFTFPE